MKAGVDVKDPPRSLSSRRWFSGVMGARPMLLFAFAFSVMADPISSVAYAIEAALRALRADLGLLLPTMAVVIAIIALVAINYHQIVARYPQGGGAAAAVGAAFGEGWAFIPIGSLIVDFTLTIAISAAAATSAIVAYLPVLAGWRIPLALALIATVAGLTWFGHVGRAAFAVMTTGFLVLAVIVLLGGLQAAPHSVGTVTRTSGEPPLVALALAFPVAMALATGVEAPSSAIAELGQLDDTGRRRFGRVTLWLTLGIVGTLTLGLTAEAVHLRIGVPNPDSTQIAELARVAVSPPLFVAFQVVTALLLLSAASSSFQAGPGLLEALAAQQESGGRSTGILPALLGRTNRRYTPYWGVVVFAVASAAVTIAAGGEDQRLVLFYAVAVFLSFLTGLLAMARFSLQQRRPASLAVNLAGAIAVGFTLVVNLSRGAPVVSIAAAFALAAILAWLWVRAGRPRGVRHAATESLACCAAPRTTPSRPPRQQPSVGRE